jgi:hypothetical protein
VGINFQGLDFVGDAPLARFSIRIFFLAQILESQRVNVRVCAIGGGL